MISWLLLSENRIESKSQQTNRNLPESKELKENAEEKKEAMIDLQENPQKGVVKPTTMHPCNCKEYCPAANSSELEVSCCHFWLVKFCYQ